MGYILHHRHIIHIWFFSHLFFIQHVWNVCFQSTIVFLWLPIIWNFLSNRLLYLQECNIGRLSKSSKCSLYFNTFLLIFDVSTHVTKSSKVLVTRNVGSVTVSGPTPIWPSSMYVTTSFKRSAKCNLTRTVAKRCLQNEETDNLSHKAKLFFWELLQYYIWIYQQTISHVNTKFKTEM